MYLYELPTTGSVSFSDFCMDQSPSKVFSNRILEATGARANLRQALKRTKRTEDGTKDYLSITKVSSPNRISCFTTHSSLQLLEDYIPIICGLMSCVAHDDIGLKWEPCARV